MARWRLGERRSAAAMETRGVRAWASGAWPPASSRARRPYRPPALPAAPSAGRPPRGAAAGRQAGERGREAADARGRACAWPLRRLCGGPEERRDMADAELAVEISRRPAVSRALPPSARALRGRHTAPSSRRRGSAHARPLPLVAASAATARGPLGRRARGPLPLLSQGSRPGPQVLQRGQSHGAGGPRRPGRSDGEDADLRRRDGGDDAEYRRRGGRAERLLSYARWGHCGALRTSGKSARFGGTAHPRYDTGTFCGRRCSILVRYLLLQ